MAARAHTIADSTFTPQTDYDTVQVTKAVGDQLRANILKALAQDSFGVLELCGIFSMAQPAMSHHLKILHEAGLVTKRREGTSNFYQRSMAANAPLLQAIFGALDAEQINRDISDGISRILEVRVQQSRHFFANQADALAQQTTLVCAPEVYTDAVLELALSQPDALRDAALEIGPGGGKLLKALAPFFKQVTGIDNAAEMLAKTQPAVVGLDNVTLLERDFVDVSENSTFDLVVAAMVIHHMAAPLQFFQQAAKVLKSNGILVTAELCEHEQAWVKELCGDVRMGFAAEELSQWANQVGFVRTHHQFLAQRNGFRVQVSAFALTPQTSTGTNL